MGWCQRLNRLIYTVVSLGTIYRIPVWNRSMPMVQLYDREFAALHLRLSIC